NEDGSADGMHVVTGPEFAVLQRSQEMLQPIEPRPFYRTIEFIEEQQRHLPAQSAIARKLEIVSEIFRIAQSCEIALMPIVLDQMFERVGKRLRNVFDSEPLACSGRAENRDSQRFVARWIRQVRLQEGTNRSQCLDLVDICGFDLSERCDRNAFGVF